jgi:uncharacterized protein
MLIEFKVTNFRSFRDEQTFSMVATSDKQLPDNLAQVAGFKLPLLRSAVVYGANASGKTTLMMALDVMRFIVVTLATQVPGAEPNRAHYPRPSTFRFSADHRNAPAQFLVTFIADGVRYEYGFAHDQERFTEEWLFGYPKGQPQRLFARSYDPEQRTYVWSLSPRLTGERQRMKQYTHERTLFLSTAASFRNEQLLPVFRWFSEQLQLIIDPDANAAGMHRYTALRAMEDPAFYQRVLRHLNFADFGIHSFAASEQPVDERVLETMPTGLRQLLLNAEAQHLEVKVRHRANADAELLIEEESRGTQRFFELIGPLINTLEHGLILAIDELDRSLHPALTKVLIELFHDPEINQAGAQLIVTTHDVTLLDQELFRRDQIWFSEKGNDGAATLIPLSDYHPRKGESLMRGYLAGRYGGVPILTRPSADMLGIPERVTAHA